MPVYAKKVSTADKRFTGRTIDILPISTQALMGSIPVPDTVVLCDGCNENQHPEPGYGYLIYLGKRELAKDQPYDFYCKRCLENYFKGYKEVHNET